MDRKQSIITTQTGAQLVRFVYFARLPENKSLDYNLTGLILI
jgi:hypothetical protein